MLHINDLTYRVEGRTLFDQATAMIAQGWIVGFTGRNGTGKSTLFRLIQDQISPDGGSLSLTPGRRIGGVAQEAAATEDTLIETVLAADTERADLLHRAEHATDPHEIARIQTRLADIDAYSAEARAAQVLSGLGFDSVDQRRPCAEFSGGWRMRVALAGALFAAPDLLLLDEPTNYLDLEGAVWLETYLKKYPYTAIVISHDRGLLNRSVSHILALEGGKLSVHPGGYDTYARRRAEQQRLAEAQAHKTEAQRAHMQAFVDRFRAKASKAKQAQSRLKALEKLKSSDVPLDESTTPFVFPAPKPAMAPPIVRLQSADLGYEEDRPVLRDLTLRIDEDDRIAILGTNGQGKSTLVKAIAGRLSPLNGNVYAHKKLKIAYFAQHQLDELRPDETPYDHVKALMPEGTEAQIRARTAGLGFGPEKADIPVRNMSGGEKARLLLGLIAFEGPHLMILDEPTNHLDIQSREALIAALDAYPGAVLLITHDAHLAEATVDRLWEVKNGAVHILDEDIDNYRARILASAKAAGEQKKTSGKTGPTAPTPADHRREAAARREALKPLRAHITGLEGEIARIDGVIAQMDDILATPGLFDTDLARATDISQKRARAEEKKAALEEAWLEASSQYEEAIAAD
ncbi:putative ATP-binding protein [Parvularcula bermudensis HTCC2503]|uniref:Putative ATP-binding protein n=1 Tax=Parvularcula bermudensis (strain ATCC BAA-594 / HTCC2503 / KCTC 12087) TaxID=314260 RepID=E0TB56_PARBH|nr:ABC-F family ATP-binding cassette domain-containing protein [Parvularcula bermudensis]ADM08260.1 putative ATP-binding protein [Parvularcula bermudensis HTCC2503]